MTFGTINPVKNTPNIAKGAAMMVFTE